MATKGYTITKKHGGLRSGLMFYADGNTRDGMVDMVSGTPGLIAGTGGSMVVRPETRGWAFTQAAGNSGLIFNTPVLERLKRVDGISVLLWGDLQQDDMPRISGHDGATQLFALDLSQGDGMLSLDAQAWFAPGGAINVGGANQYLVTWKLGGDTRFYKDGGLFGINTNPNTAPISGVGDVIVIGNSLPLLSEFAGVGNVFFGAAVWNRELRADEALHLANDPFVLRRLCWRKKLLITNY